MILDPTESHLQLLHHGDIIGGNWSNPTKKLVAILGTDWDAKPVQLAMKSIKNIKEMSYSFDDLVDILTPDDLEYLYKNVIPTPNFLTKIFVNLKSTEPLRVAKAFIESVLDQEGKTSKEKPSGEASTTNGYTDGLSTTSGISGVNTDKFLLSDEDILYAVQFCQLCSMGKIPPVTYSLVSDPDVTSWFKAPQLSRKEAGYSNKCTNPSTPNSDDESESNSPENKISKKDHCLINTMLKLHDTMDKTSKTREEKEPGFNRLEAHRKLLILNASAIPPYTTAASSPTEFYQTFLAKKSQLKPKTC